MQDTRAGICASPGHGFPLQGPHAGGCFCYFGVARYRIRRGRSMNVNVLPRTRMNVDEFLAWSARQPDDRYELVDGKIIAMTRDSVRHNRTKFAAARALDDAVRAAGLPCSVFVDGVGVRINERTLRIPDVMVHCGADPDPDALIIESPLIVVEVVSPSSKGDDIETKVIDYFSVASIRHYLIIYSEQRVMIHHRR